MLHHREREEGLEILQQGLLALHSHANFQGCEGLRTAGMLGYRCDEGAKRPRGIGTLDLKGKCV